MFYRISYQPWGGADFRMLTAINIAQWDILGKASGLPVYKLLGGKAQEKLMVYNTMNGWPINGMREHTDPEKLTEFLLKRGIRGIKIYPYDRGPVNALAQHGGTFITQSELKKSLDPIQRIRKAAGDEIEIALDLSSRWNLPCSHADRTFAGTLRDHVAGRPDAGGQPVGVRVACARNVHTHLHQRAAGNALPVPRDVRAAAPWTS